MGRTLCLGAALLASIISLAVAAPPRSGDPSVAISILTGCRANGTSLYCLAGTTQYHIATTLTATRTQELPAQFTNCHGHGGELECYGPNGDEVEVHLVGGESTASGATNRTITATSTATAAAATTTTTSAGAGATIDTSPAVTPAATLATPTTSAPAVSTVAGSNFSGATTLDARFCAWLGFVAATAAALLFAVASV